MCSNMQDEFSLFGYGFIAVHVGNIFLSEMVLGTIHSYMKRTTNRPAELHVLRP